MGRPKKSAVCKTCNRGPTNQKALKTSGTQTELKLDELDKIISFFLCSSDKACREAQENLHPEATPIWESRSCESEISNELEESSTVESTGDKQNITHTSMDSNQTKATAEESDDEQDQEFMEYDVEDSDYEVESQTSDDAEAADVLSTTEILKATSTSFLQEVRKSSRLAQKYPSRKSFASPTRKHKVLPPKNNGALKELPTKERKLLPQKKNIVALKKVHLASLRLKPKTGAQRSKSLECLLCGLSCKTSKEVSEHEVNEHDGRVYKCGQCDKVFRSLAQRRIHIRCHTGEKPYSCSKCPKRFPDPSNLKKHIQTIHQHPHRCGHCRARFAIVSELMVHQESTCRMKTDHNGRKLFPELTPKTDKKPIKKVKCETCSKEVINLRNHMLTHSNLRPHQCTECDALFKSTHDLKKHKLRHVSDQQLLCELCGKSFKHIFAIKAHMKIHDDPVVREVHPCKECNMGFAEAELLAAHTECHLNNLAFKCLLCDKEFEAIKELKAHVLKHPAAKIPVNCNFCDKIYPTLPKMQVHRHSHVSFHMCSFCSKTYTKTSELKRHEATHTGIFNHVCELCNKGFVRPDQLKKHMMVHTGDRKFKCEICERSYITDDTLKTHIKLVHGPKTYICTICGKSFAVEKRLKFHLARHLGIKDYKCDVCGKCFADPSDLPQHKRIHKIVKKFPCLLCPKAFYAQQHLDTHFRVNHKNRTQKVIHDCRICGKIFPREWKLKRHQNVHENRRNRIHYLNKPNVPTVIKLEPIEEPDIVDIAESTSMLQSLEKAELTQTLTVLCSMCGASCETTELPVTDSFVCGMCSQIESDDKTTVFTFTGQEVFKCNMCQKTFALLDNFLSHLQEHPELEIKIETLPTDLDQ